MTQRSVLFPLGKAWLLYWFLGPEHLMNISIIIPAYNEEATIAEVIRDIRTVLTQTEHRFEILVVDDASTDSTYKLALSCDVKVLSHKFNKGYGRSIKDGIKETQYEYVLIMDADGQHIPGEIPKLLEQAEEYDMVIGARQGNASHMWRLPGKWLLGKFCNYLMKARIPDVNSGMRVFKKQVMEQYVHLCSNEFSFSTSSTLAFLADERDVLFVEIAVLQRNQGKSRVSVNSGFQALLLVLQIAMAFHPLRFFLPAALGVLVYGVLFSLYGIFWFNSFPKTGILTILAGITIFCFGLLADQGALIRRELKKER